MPIYFSKKNDPNEVSRATYGDLAWWLDPECWRCGTRPCSKWDATCNKCRDIRGIPDPSIASVKETEREGYRDDHLLQEDYDE